MRTCLVENDEAGLAIRLWFPSRLREHFIWIIIDFGIVQQQSTIVHIYVLDQISHTITQLFLEIRIGLVEIAEVGVKIPLYFPSQASWKCMMNYYWLWNNITLVYNHRYMSFGSKQPTHYSISLQNGDLLGIQHWGWTTNPSMIPISGFMNLAYELFLSLNWYSSSLKWHTHGVTTTTATTLLRFSMKWGLAW